MDKTSSSPTALFGTESHQLKLGRSFDRDRHRAFHTVRYDFKPASIDHTKEALLEVGEGHEVNITLPNVESKGTAYTKFKGSKRPLQKECVLIYDHRTGEFTLERLTCNMQVKKQREEGTSKAQLSSRPLSSLDPSNLRNSPNFLGSTSSKGKKGELSTMSSALTTPDTEQGGEISPLQPSPLAPSPHTPPSHHVSSNHEDTDSSGSYFTDSESEDNAPSQKSSGTGSSSSDDEDGQEMSSQMMKNGTLTSTHSHHGKSRSPPMSKLLSVHQDNAQYIRSQLSRDLQLSESDSDSD
ncbi:uncharacterized protein [Asterias amurensis]|uniref:uncharacterized protein n=1 Tax=Asterias amurensis TaxID=7602 RepID=UPI003AB4BD2C